MIHILYVTQSLLFEQEASAEGKWASVSQQLNFVQSVRCNIKYVQASNVLKFTQSVTREPMVINRAVADYLNFQQVAKPRVFDIAVNQTLTFTEDVRRIYGVNQQLVFVETVQVHKAKGVLQTLTFTQDVSVQRDANMIINQTLTFTQAAKCYKTSPTYISSVINNPPTSNEELPAQDMVFSLGSLTLTLPAPDFNNTEEHNNAVIINRTRGRDLHAYRDSPWPKTYTLKYKWSYLKPIDLENIRYFIDQTLGLIVDLVDYENRNFSGIIKTPQNPIVQLGRENRTYEIHLELV